MNIDLNKILSKRSGITAIAIWAIMSLAATGVWYALVAMGLIAVLSWRYMDLDHSQQERRIEAGLEKPQQNTKGDEA